MDITSKKKKEDNKPKDKELERRIGRVKYLMEKYGYRWRNKVKKGRFMIDYCRFTGHIRTCTVNLP